MKIVYVLLIYGVRGESKAYLATPNRVSTRVNNKFKFKYFPPLACE